MITYNHAQYIAQAIDGVLKQQTDFLVELVIGEDCSTDKTREICSQFKTSYPEQIVLLNASANLGMIPNFVNALKNCRGKYIALCEGDDYWTDPLKLQKQIDFLEANPDYSICFHPVKVIYENGNQESRITNKNQASESTFEDLASGNFIHTVSNVFRNNQKTLPEWFKEMAAGDYPLHLLNAAHGKIKYINEVMAVYRIHDGGIWSRQKQTEMSLKWIPIVEQCREHFKPRGAVQFDKQLADVYAFLCFNSYNDEEYAKVRCYYQHIFKLKRFYSKRTFLAATLRYLLSFEPRLAHQYKNFRTRKNISN